MAYWTTWGLRIFTVCIIGVAVGFARDRAERERYASEHLYEDIGEYWAERGRKESEAEAARLRRQVEETKEQLEAQMQRVRETLLDRRREPEAEGGR